EKPALLVTEARRPMRGRDDGSIRRDKVKVVKALGRGIGYRFIYIVGVFGAFGKVGSRLLLITGDGFYAACDLVALMLKLAPDLLHERGRALLFHLAKGLVSAGFDEPSHGPDAGGDAQRHQEQQLGLELHLSRSFDP